MKRKLLSKKSSETAFSEQIKRITYYEKLMDTAEKLKNGTSQKKKALAELEKYYSYAPQLHNWLAISSAERPEFFSCIILEQ